MQTDGDYTKRVVWPYGTTRLKMKVASNRLQKSFSIQLSNPPPPLLSWANSTKRDHTHTPATQQAHVLSAEPDRALEKIESFRCSTWEPNSVPFYVRWKQPSKRGKKRGKKRGSTSWFITKSEWIKWGITAIFNAEPKSPKDLKSILILTKELLYTYFWKMLPVGALILLAPIWLIWAQISQPTSNHLNSSMELAVIWESMQATETRWQNTATWTQWSEHSDWNTNKQMFK